MASLNIEPGYIGYAGVPILLRPEVAYTEIVMPLELPNVDIFDKRYCKALSLQEAVQKIFSYSKIQKTMSCFHRSF